MNATVKTECLRGKCGNMMITISHYKANRNDPKYRTPTDALLELHMSSRWLVRVRYIMVCLIRDSIYTHFTFKKYAINEV